MIKVSVKGNFKKTQDMCERALNLFNIGKLDAVGKQGVEALREATPKDTGRTSESWSYKIERKEDHVSIIWSNSNRSDGVPVAILIQYGHVGRGGAWVKGIDFINPALKPIFKSMAEDLRKEVIR